MSYRRATTVKIGEVFGYLEVVGEPIKGAGGFYLPVKCACGNVVTKRWGALNGGSITSCGCRFGKYTHGGRHTRMYRIWSNMKDRCLNPNNSAYANYGGKGVQIDSDWLEFAGFRSWADSSGYTDELTIERIDPQSDYTPGNCTWIPLGEQADNKTNTIWITYLGETKNLKQWANDPRIHVRYHTAYVRIVRRGWDPIQAILTPPRIPKLK